MRETNCIPINRTAALVISKGFEYVPDKNIVDFHSHVCPPLRDIIGEKLAINKDFVDLTGVKFGEFVVVGMPVGKRHVWVVRCRCGMFELRRSKAIKNEANYVDRCQICKHLAYLKRHSEFLAFGSNKKESLK